MGKSVPKFRILSGRIAFVLGHDARLMRVARDKYSSALGRVATLCPCFFPGSEPFWVGDDAG